jgi:hypothetical protein
MLGAAYFLLGDSTPQDVFVADALRKRIGPYFTSWTDEHEIFPSHVRPFRNFEHRAELFRSYMANQPQSGPIILLGRSSGARVASLCATVCNASAVVCLGYPFRRPGRGPDPDRYRHLETIQIPTLILQGRSDTYGRADDLADYALSTSVSVRAIATNHRMRLRARHWDGVGQAVLSFCQAALADNNPYSASRCAAPLQ